MFGITFPAKVTRVLDGDTLEVKIERTIRIRILDCWAMETRTVNKQEKDIGITAKQFLKNLILDKEVTLEIPIEGDKFGDSMTFGRVLGVVKLDGKDVARIMIENGYAYPTKELQKEALKIIMDELKND